MIANAFYDRAGFCLLGDVFRSTTFGPWKRALVKVDKEETFHLRHGENGMRKIAQTDQGKAEPKPSDIARPLQMTNGNRTKITKRYVRR